MAQAQTPRLHPEERRDLLIVAARQIFAEKGYTRAGLADVATRANVSKTLLYHYFPEGRPELYREVIHGLADRFAGALHTALGAPVSADERLQRAVVALFDGFGNEPDAYRLLVSEPWGSGDAGVIAEATAAHARLAAELSRLVAHADQPADVALAGSAASLAVLLQACGLWLADELTRERAVALGLGFCRGGLNSLGLHSS